MFGEPKFPKPEKPLNDHAEGELYEKLVNGVDSGKFFDGSEMVARRLTQEEYDFLVKGEHADIIDAAREKGMLPEAGER